MIGELARRRQASAGGNAPLPDGVAKLLDDLGRERFGPGPVEEQGDLHCVTSDRASDDGQNRPCTHSASGQFALAAPRPPTGFLEKTHSIAPKWASRSLNWHPEIDGIWTPSDRQAPALAQQSGKECMQSQRLCRFAQHFAK
ncbi:MAG TPA: hypothetical protein VEK55_07680 [Xanthobacteraceae bacterium]|nr:hypothetical protein [Xanthobacteraceae bacterium]